MLREREGGGERAPDEERELAPKTERSIRCKRCGAEVTHERAAIAVEGRHTHDFVNPAGVSFVVRCFGDAPGCEPYGDASSFFSWFAGHQWRIAVCAACGVHLGWRFEGATSVLFGLITDRIAESP